MSQDCSLSETACWAGSQPQSLPFLCCLPRIMMMMKGSQDGRAEHRKCYSSHWRPWQTRKVNNVTLPIIPGLFLTFYLHIAPDRHYSSVSIGLITHALCHVETKRVWRGCAGTPFGLTREAGHLIRLQIGPGTSLKAGIHFLFWSQQHSSWQDIWTIIFIFHTVSLNIKGQSIAHRPKEKQN